MNLRLVILSIPFLLVFMSGRIVAQEIVADSCSGLVFSTKLESTGFESFCSKKPDYLLMSVAVDPESTESDLADIRQMIKNETDILKMKTEKIKKPVKALQIIFSHVQTSFLKHYDLDAGFSKMFKTGYYNCLTATILYSLILDELGYRNTPKVLPGHVYLIAYGGETPYLFETTDPEHGFMQLNDAVLTSTLQSLRLFKFIQSDNIENQPVGNIFDRYYLKLNTTNLRGLVGYQYINTMVQASMKQHSLEAYQALNKAIVLTPLDELLIMKEQLLRASIAEMSLKSAERARYVVEYYNHTKNQNKEDQVIGEFSLMINQCLFGSFPTPDSLHTIYNALVDGIQDTLVQSKLKELYYVNYTSYLLMNEETDKAFRIVYDAYRQVANSMQVKVILSKLVEFYTSTSYTDKRNFEVLDSLASEYPGIRELDYYRARRCYLTISLASKAFDENQIATGEKYLTMFESDAEALSQQELVFCDPAEAYGDAASCYFRKGNMTKARRVINKGLVYSPGNWMLTAKLKQIDK